MKRKWSWTTFFVLSLFLSVFVPNPAFSAETKKPSVAVLWFENRTPDRKLDYLDQLIPDLITAESSKIGFCNLLEREEIEKALNEVMLSKQGFMSPIEKSRGGIAETTDFILSGYFEQKEENLVVSVRLYNWKKGTSQTKDFTYTLSEIKERAGKEITAYLQTSTNLKEDSEKRAATIPENARIIIFLDVRHTFFNYDVVVDNIIYDYPHGVILLEKLKDDFQSRGVSCEIITNKDDWNRILQKNPVPAQPARIYQIFRNDISASLTIAIRDLGTTDSPINPQTAELGNIKSKTLSPTSSPFSSLKEDDILQYILGSAGKETCGGNETYSPKVESLIYYDNYLRQKGYGDYAAAYQEILKALYLYPDFSFYRFILKEYYYNSGKYEFFKSEKEMQAIETYLGLSSWSEHFLIYSDTLRIYIISLARKRMLSSGIAVRLVPLMEKIIYEGYESKDSKWRKTDSAVLLSRLYLLGEVTEIKLINLKEKGLISEAEYQNDLCWAFLMSKLSFTKEEGLESVNRSLSWGLDWENYYNWYERGLPFFLPDSVWGRFRQSIDKQKEFLSVVQEAVRKYPDALANCYVIKNIPGDFDHDLVEKELAKIIEKVPNSLTSRCIRGDLISNVTPKSIRSRLESEFGLKREAPGEEVEKNNLFSQKTKETRVLVDAELEGLKETLDSIGWGTDIFSKETDLSNLSKYKLIILHFNSFISEDKNGRYGFQPSLFSQIIAGLDNGVFILIIPGKSDRIPEINPFLSQFNCYVDDKKEFYSEAVFVPGVFKDVIDTHLDYHSSVSDSPTWNWQWEKFFIKGPPIYAEKGKVIIQNANGYPVAVSIPLPNGTLILSGEIYELFNIHLSRSGCELYKGLIFRNIWQILLNKMFGGDSVLTPVSTIKKLQDFYWEFRLADKILSGGDLFDPLSGWITRKRWSALVSPFSEERVFASAGILKEVLKENPDLQIRNYCFFHLGLIRRFQKQDEEAISYFKKARENAVKYEDSLVAAFFLADTLIRKDNFSKDDYELCNKYCKEGTGIKIGRGDNYSFLRKMRFYDLQGRLEEKVKNYAGAVVSYEKMVAISGQMYSSQYVAYALCRRACLIYKSGNLDAAEKSLLELIGSLSNPKPDSWAEFDFYSQGENDYGLIPVPFEIKVASYLYLREIAKKENRKFLHQTELEEVIQAAEKRNFPNKDLLSQLKIILRGN
ncbi:MAG: hypothetical protein WC338_02045 [Candidatus Ratteibacteria bacterium]